MQMIKRTLSILLTVVMLVSMFSMVNVAFAAEWDGTVATEFESGSGTEADPYIIIDAAQLAYMNAVIGDGTQASAYFKLGADITLNEGLLDEDYNVLKTPSVSWDSQGTFSGVFDGNGKTIYGFYTKKTGSGLFNEVTGTIKNLTMKDAYVNMNWTSHGILASVMTGATIDKVEIDGFMTGKMAAGGHNRGMMAGSGYATFTNCIVMGKSLATGDAMATQGAGYLGNVGGETSFTNCINYADIEGFAMAGGFVGVTGNTVNFTDCINYGVIKTGTAYSKWSSASNNQHSSEAGGFVGAVWAANVNITRCANEGAITGDSYAGGFVGVVLNSKTPVITINNAYNVGIITTIGTHFETTGIQYSGDFVAHQYVGTYNSSSTGAGDLTAYQAGAWLGTGADRWAYGQAMNPYLTYFGTVGHVHSYTESGTEPTCTEGGQTLYTCGCGFTYSVEKAALGHDYVEEIIEATSCAKEGLTSFTCSRCDDTYTETIPTVDHGYVMGYCVYCGVREEYTPVAAEWDVDFVDANGNAIDTVSTANGEFWMVFRLTNYADRIGEMNNTGDLATSTYDRTIAVASLFVAMDNSEIIGVRENNKIVYATPYETATLTTNYDTTDGMLKAIFLSDENAGCTFSVGKSDLDANNGELFRIKVKSKLTEAGEIAVKLVEESEYAASSVALVNKPVAGEWVNG
ncbi:MAG: hypothetical protein IIW73_05085, partial [Clostridia bacterium]|nr:hypothetical protein [Clostridia bacterium]